MGIGGFPGGQSFNRRTIRGAVNPLDICSLFSIYDKRIEECKHTIQPGHFIIEAGNYEHPSRLVVGPSSWWREIDEEQPLLEIAHSSIQVANSIVNDYCTGLLGYTSEQRPGLFFLPGDISTIELRSNKKYNGALELARTRQDNWYKALVKLADTMWARTNGNPLCISDDMRTAASALSLTGKDWMADFTMMETVKCAACGSPRNPKYPICPNCHNIVDRELAERLGIMPATHTFGNTTLTKVVNS